MAIGSRVFARGVASKRTRCALLATSTATLLSVSDAHAAPPGAPRGPDWDHDGFDDLVVYTVESTGMVDDHGAVNFLYGTNASGVEAAGGNTLYFDQNVSGVLGDIESGDEFGAALAWGDFDGDCYEDVVVGIPGETVGVLAGAGAVHIFYSGASGPTTSDEIWHSDDTGIPGAAEAGDRFGAAVAVGDFDGDDVDDLAIGAPNEEVSSAGAAGAVTIMYGIASTGLDSTGSVLYYQGDGNLQDSAESGDSFGQALAAGDFNCDGYDDLAVGVPGEDTSEGGVQIIYGSNSGLGAVDLLFDQDYPNVLGASTSGDKFGSVLAVGNFNNDSSSSIPCMDLAVGVPLEDTGVSDAGVVQVFFGTSSNGIQFSSPDDNLLSQNVGAIEDTEEVLDRFGHSLVAGNMDTDSYTDLAIGVVGEDMEGAVAIIRGSSLGMTDTSDVLWSQDTASIPDSGESGDGFGHALGFGMTYDATNSIGALVVGVPFEAHSSLTDPGLIQVIYLDDTATPTILSAESWEQDQISGTVEASEYMGSSLFPSRAIGDQCP